MRRVRKIKVDTTRITIDWEIDNGDGRAPDEYHLKCADMARPEFYKALAAIRQDVIELLELPPAWLDDIKVKGATFSYTEKGTKGVVITATRDLKISAAPMNLNTPHVPYDSQNPDKFVIPYFTEERLNKLEEEAERYIDGDRAQGSLFDAPEAATEEVTENKPA